MFLHHYFNIYIYILIEFKFNKSSYKSSIFKLFIAILSPHIFLKIICDVGTAQCEHRTIKCNISRLSTCGYCAP